MACTGLGVGSFRPADVLLQFDRQGVDGTFGLVAGAGCAEFGRDPTDGRQDRHFFLLWCRQMPDGELVTSLLFQLHFMSIAGLYRGRFGATSNASCLDGVDYRPNLMFNQTKWNDALYQKN